jgi:DNA uptake protein ComE-like DNA-binding protein
MMTPVTCPTIPALTSRQLRHHLFIWPVLLALTILTGCATKPDNAKVQQDAAQATQTAKQDTKQLAQNTKAALQTAENTVDAAADGVKQGIASKTGPADSSAGKTPAGKIDLNSASHDQLAALPGIDSPRADAIIAGRPYATPRGVVTKGILTPAQFHRIAPEVATQQ